MLLKTVMTWPRQYLCFGQSLQSQLPNQNKPLKRSIVSRNRETKMITLRDYQANAVESAYAYWQNNTNCIIEAPCGAGKSLIIGKICHDSITHDVRVLVVTHRKNY